MTGPYCHQCGQSLNPLDEAGLESVAAELDATDARIEELEREVAASSERIAALTAELAARTVVPPGPRVTAEQWAHQVWQRHGLTRAISVPMVALHALLEDWYRCAQKKSPTPLSESEADRP